MICSKCGTNNRTNSKYCQTCAFDLSKADAPVNVSQPNFTELPSDSAHFPDTNLVQPEIGDQNRQFTTADLFITEPPVNSFPLKNQQLIGAAVLGFFILFGGVFLVYSLASQGDSPNSNNVVMSIANTNKSPMVASFKQNNQSYSTSFIVKTGRMVTDLNVRDEPNKDALSLGIHFMNAKVKVLEETSYEMEGKVATWYRVQVTEYGCSKDPNLGCGKNSPNDSDEGWVNAKHILLD